MTEPLRIAVADDERDMRDYYQTMLPRLGHLVVAVAENGREWLELCRKLKPSLGIVDIRMPEMDGIDAAVEIYHEHPLPVILVSAYHDAELIARAESDHILAYLVKPIKQADLQPAIALAMQRFDQFQALRQEAANWKQALEDRKIVEKAKGIIMKRGKLTEEDAFRHLQKTASARNLKLTELAKTLILADEAMQGLP